MKKIWIPIIVVVIIIGVVAVFYKPASKGTIKIGVITPLSGTMVQMGEWTRNGLELAKEEINQKGINGRRIELIYEDSQGDPKTAVLSAKKLISQDKVLAIITSSGAPSALAVKEVANQEKIIQLEAICYPTECHTLDDYLFRMSDTVSTQAYILADFLVKKLHKEKPAVLYINNDLGISLLQNFTERLSKYGIKPTALESFLLDTEDFRTQLTKIKAKSPDVLLIFSYFYEAGTIAKQMEELGMNIQLLGTPTTQSPQTLEVGKEAIEGIIYPYPGFGLRGSEAEQKYIKEYRERYDKEPEAIGAKVYDALKILTFVITKCNNNLNSNCFKEELEKICDFQGASNNICFDEYGDLKEETYILKTIKNGQFVPYEV